MICKAIFIPHEIHIIPQVLLPCRQHDPTFLSCDNLTYFSNFTAGYFEYKINIVLGLRGRQPA